MYLHEVNKSPREGASDGMNNRTMKPTFLILILLALAGRCSDARVEAKHAELLKAYHKINMSEIANQSLKWELGEAIAARERAEFSLKESERINQALRHQLAAAPRPR